MLRDSHRKDFNTVFYLKLDSKIPLFLIKGKDKTNIMPVYVNQFF